jgi:hypothetical protein
MRTDDNEEWDDAENLLDQFLGVRRYIEAIFSSN